MNFLLLSICGGTVCMCRFQSAIARNAIFNATRSSTMHTFDSAGAGDDDDEASY